MVATASSPYTGSTSRFVALPTRSDTSLLEGLPQVDPDMAEAEPSLPSRLNWLLLPVLILGWYTTSILLTLFNKWLFTTYGFHFPLSVTSIHLLLKIPAAWVVMQLAHLPYVSFGGWRGLCRSVVPLGVSTAADIALSNLSMLYITVTYYTIFKSSVPLWILAFSVWLGLQRCRLELLCVLLCIGCGIALASVDPAAFADDAEEVPDDSFNASATLDDVDLAPSARRVLEELASDLPHILIGEMLVLGASMCAGFRWACTQLLLNPQAATEPRRHTLTAADELGEPDSASQISGDDVRAARTGASAGVCGVPRGSNGHGSGGGRGGDGSGVGEGSCECVCDGACCDGAREGGDGASYTSDDTDHSAPPPLHPVTLLYYITPFGLLVLLPMAIALESGDLRVYLSLRAPDQLLRVGLLASVGGVISFVLLLLELRVVQLSSGLTLSIAGIFKELLTVAASAVFLGDQLTSYNIGGLLLCLVGIYFYNVIKRRDEREAQEPPWPQRSPSRTPKGFALSAAVSTVSSTSSQGQSLCSQTALLKKS